MPLSIGNPEVGGSRYHGISNGKSASLQNLSVTARVVGTNPTVEPVTSGLSLRACGPRNLMKIHQRQARRAYDD
jgi:hypothetical protein